MIKRKFIPMLMVLFWLVCFLNSADAKTETIVINNTWWKEIQKNEQKWEDLELYFISSTWGKSHYTIMDRNLWASEVYNWEKSYSTSSLWINPGSYGYHYQWWNNYWFESYWSDVCTGLDRCYKFPWGELTTWNLVPYGTWSNYMPSKYASNVWVSSSNWMDWSKTWDNIWWWSQDTKDSDWPWNITWRQWPCPKWYHVPSVREWSTLISLWSNSSSSTWLWEDLLLTPAIIRESYWTVPIRNVPYGAYWTSSASDTNANEAYEVFLYSDRYNISTIKRSQWTSVRCFKDKSNSDININLNWWYWLIRIIDGKILSEPKKDNATFGWWYSDSSFNNKVELWDEVKWSLYAKWVYTVTFDTKWWTMIESQVVEASWHATQPEDPKLPRYTFEWWYTTGSVYRSHEYVDEDVLFNFDTLISWDITLRAKWVEYDYFTDKDLELYFVSSTWSITHRTIMDRNIWATDHFNQNFKSPNPESYWYHYQWWNNYWFDTCIAKKGEECSQFPWWESTTQNLVDVWVYGNYIHSKYATGVFVNNSYTWMKWIEFLAPQSSEMWWGRWDSIWYDWDYWTLVDRKWPCPEWYHVPSVNEWTDIYGIWSDSSRYNSDNLQFASDLLLPPAWYRDWYHTDVYYQWMGWYYWSSSRGDYHQWYSWNPSKSSNWYYYEDSYALTFPTDESDSRWKLSTTSKEYDIEWYSVRCFKNSANDPYITIHPDWWTWAVISLYSSFTNHSSWVYRTFSSPVVISLTDPTKSWYTFQWWYTTSWFKDWTKVNVWDMLWYESRRNYKKPWYKFDLYAKWVKNITVTFDVNWWTVIDSLSMLPWWKVAKPKDPEFPWYTFEWWYSDKNFKNQFNFDTSITWDITLYAKRSNYIYSFNDIELYSVSNTWRVSYVWLMDRNLWATATWAWKNSSDKSYGYYYQWWNNYWFTKWALNTVSTAVPYSDWSKYVPYKYASKNFVKWSSGNWMEWFEKNKNLWWSGSEVARKWPCPEWYHIPSEQEWSEAKKGFNNSTIIDALLLPYGGYIGVNVGGQWYFAYYWSSYSNSIIWRNMDAWWVWSHSSPSKRGFTVRCFKNSSSSKLDLITNWWTGGFVVVNWWKVYKLWDSTKSWYIFGWWYSDPSYVYRVSTWTDVSKISSLYAKFLQSGSSLNPWSNNLTGLIFSYYYVDENGLELKKPYTTVVNLSDWMSHYTNHHLPEFDGKYIVKDVQTKVWWNTVDIWIYYSRLYTLQIDYVKDWWSVAKSFKAYYISGQSYDVPSPSVTGYKPNASSVKWKIFWSEFEIVHQVKYTQIK